MSVGAYATQTEMENRFGHIELVEATNLEDTTTGEINTTVLGKKMDEANSICDGYIQSKYTLPLSSFPPALVGVACAIARYLLWQNRASDRILAGYEAAISWLKDVAKGLVALGPTATDTAPIIAQGATYSEDAVSATNTLTNISDYFIPAG